MTNSAITYKELQEEGLINVMERKVLDFIKLHGPCNGNDIDEIIPGGHKRLASLERKHLIVDIGSERDIRTHRINTIYKVVANPTIQRIVEVKSKPTYKELESKLNEYPQKMSALYDEAFKRGVVEAVEYFRPPHISMLPCAVPNEDIVNQIIEATK